MAYIGKNLIPGEHVLYEGHVSLWSLTKWLLGGAIGLLGFAMPVVWAAAPFFLVGVGSIAAALLIFVSTEFAVTNKRVVSKRGFIARDTVEISLNRVEGVEVLQTVAQRALNYGTVVVSGTGSFKAEIQNVADPTAFRAAFLEAIDADTNGSAAPVPSPAPVTAGMQPALGTARRFRGD